MKNRIDFLKNQINLLDKYKKEETWRVKKLQKLKI